MSNDPIPQLESDKPSKEIFPLWVRICSSVFLFIAILLSTYPLIKAAYWNPTDAELLSKLGLGKIIYWSLIALFIINIPWHRIALVFSKVGPVEFQTALEGQNKEYASIISPLELQVNEIQKSIEDLQKSNNDSRDSNNGSQGNLDIEQVVLKDALSEILVKFLNIYCGQFFNAPRIKKWGGAQSGFEAIPKWSTKQIDQRLRLLLANGLIYSQISKSGNTLYGIRDS